METNTGLREITLGELLDETVSKFGDHDALVYADRDFRLTYRQFNDLVDEMAKGLMAGSNCPVHVMEQMIHRLHMTDVTICYGLTEMSEQIWPDRR